jgi:hypothetical protein
VKAERADEPHGAKHRKHREHDGKPKRTAETGPLGFDNVMNDVAGGKGTQGPLGHRKDGEAPDLSALVMLGMGAVPTTEQIVRAAADGTAPATLGLDASNTAATQQSTVPSELGRMTPGALLTRVVDEATKLEIEHASKTLHVELEPAHLGPLVVSLKREPNGALDIRFRAKRGDAARVLDSGTDMLRERLAAAGFTTANIAVDQDESL